MIPQTVEQVTTVVGGSLESQIKGAVIERICTDSRGVSPGALFVAMKGERTDGHNFLADAFENGATAAIISSLMLSKLTIPPNRPLIVVADPLRALQALAAQFRQTSIKKVLAITGSNGKTIVKDAIGALLSSHRVHLSPGSYNSQLGLSLSILSAERYEALAILEVGVSKPGEMAEQERVSRPDFGILTNIGTAHLAAFGDREAIAREKMMLFRQISQSGWVLLPANEPLISKYTGELRCKTYVVGSDKDIISLKSRALVDDGLLASLSIPNGKEYNIRIRTYSADILSDLHFAATAAYLLGISLEDIAASLEGYLPATTRMEVWTSPEGIRIINDAYSSDPISVGSALKTASAMAGKSGRRVFAFAGMRELGKVAAQEHHLVGVIAAERGFDPILLVGNGNLDHTVIGYQSVRPEGKVVRVSTPENLNNELLPLLEPGDTVLYKGPRKIGMLPAVQELQSSIAQRCLWVDLAAIGDNLSRFQRQCGGRVKIMAMLKALAYGTDLVDLASSISRIGIQHIGVSSTAEGVAVRRSGADQDIYVFLASRDDVENLLRYRLTPILYSKELIEQFSASLINSSATLDVHLKVDTGMHRLGVAPSDALDAARNIRNSGRMRLAGVCTHFAAADDPKLDSFTRQQIKVFDDAIREMRNDGFKDFVVHAANTAAAARFSDARYDMVRIGIGLYGIYPSPAVRKSLGEDLELAIGVTSRIASIRNYDSGASLGYGRSYQTRATTKVGVVPFGYDDGLPWRLSGKGHVLVQGKIAPIVGRISMDQMQVDVSDIQGVHIGAEVLIYGAHGGYSIRPEEVAEQADTIAHELLVRLGRRVRRIYSDQ